MPEKSPPLPNNEEGEGDLAVEQVRKVKPPKRHKVIFHNDDYTTREFVIETLMRNFEKDESEATYVMLSVHHKGQGIAGIYPVDIAESKAARVIQDARKRGFPLMVTTEPEPE